MSWPTADQMMSLCPPADGYVFEVLRRSSVPELVAALRVWQPAWQIGAASVFTRESYYERFVYFEGEDASDCNVFVILLRGQGDLAGMLAVEQIPDALSLYASLAVLTPHHRGRKAPMFKGDYLEAVARHIALEFVYTLATLKHRGSRRYFESMGYQLIGFVPGCDREEIAPGVVKRVIEAAYCKVLAPRDALLRPNLEDMTRRCKRCTRESIPRGGRQMRPDPSLEPTRCGRPPGPGPRQRYIFSAWAKASCLRMRLSSNVRRQSKGRHENDTRPS